MTISKLGNHKSEFIIFVVVFGLILFTFRSILFNINANLSDWNDYPLYVWILYQNISHIATLSFSEFFNGNIFYPDKGTLLLSDLFLPQTFIAFFISKFIKNPITTFNVVYFISWATNIVAAQYFWNKVTRNKLIVFFATLATTISSFTLVNSVHFQMINYWPFFFGLGKLIDEKITNSNAIQVAFWVSIQLLSGIYLGFFMLFSVGVWYLVRVKEIFSKKYFSKYVSHLSLFLLVLLFLAGPFLYQYYLVKQDYHAIRDYGEYVQYSMHLTDYLFPPHLDTIFGKFSIVKKWASFGRGAGFFPGFVLLISAFIGFFNLKQIKNILRVNYLLNNQNIFFTLLLILGFSFSFGPRLSVNGFYTEIPLPYDFLLKLIPGFDIIRVTSRWSWLFFIALIFYSVKGFEKHSKKYRYLPVVASFILMAEILPLQRLTEAKDYYSYEYKYLESICNESTVLLEYPMTQDNDNVNIVTNLTYRTQMMMATINHKCALVNGYTGWIPTEYTQFENQLFLLVENNNKEKFFNLILERGTDIFKLNKNDIFTHKVQKLNKWLHEYELGKVIYTDENHTILKLKK